MLRLKYAGFSLLELLIGIVVGIMVVAGAVKIFTNSSTNMTEHAQVARLDEDLRNMMAVMTDEIQRAGFVSGSPNISVLQNNIFSDLTFEDIVIKGVTYPKACMLLMYNKDAKNPSVVDNDERFGFRLALDTSFSPDKRLLRMWRGGTNWACNSATPTNWITITSPEVEITNLKFELSETMLNVTQRENSPGVAITNPPPACNAVDKCLIVRNVAVTLTGALKDGTTQTLMDRVRVRNDQYCHYGIVGTNPARCRAPSTMPTLSPLPSP